ncbi:MAG: septal ring lytic transglycosylase RlpA family protein [Spirochaetaceae bacterium]|nr:MAG: septal ring lytic transglycosylase RlpA family protein [Spirochaetaceae bacterium]
MKLPVANHRSRHRTVPVAALLAIAALAAFAPAPVSAEGSGHELSGYASWYGGKFQGRLTANGERFDTNELTAAHRTLAFNTVVEVRHLANGRRVRVRINDRGPFVDGRVIDLSRAAADAIGMTGEGIARVEITVVEHPPEQRRVIQVVALSSAARADAIARELRRHDLPATVERAGTVYRVVVAGVLDSEVPSVRARLADLGHAQVLVRSR